MRAHQNTLTHTHTHTYQPRPQPIQPALHLCSSENPCWLAKVDIVKIDRAPDKSYQPGHPKADKDGYIYTAAVDTEEEMVEMLEASRQYENNVEVISTLRSLMMRTINMGK